MKYKKISPNAVNEKNIKKWKIPENKNFGKYVVDDTNFIPMSEQVKEIAKMRPLGAETIKMSYDYPDGKDRGKEIPFSRTKEGRGMVELSKHITEKTKSIEKAKKTAINKAVEEVQRVQNIKNLVEN